MSASPRRNRLLELTPDERKRGVVTASAGNHAQAVAYHGSRLGIAVQVVMPEHTPLIKVSNTRRFGVEVHFRGATLSDAIALTIVFDVSLIGDVHTYRMRGVCRSRLKVN